MQFPCIVRGFTARPWKNKSSGAQNYSGSFVVLDMSPRPVMNTVTMDRDFESEEAMKKAALLVGKTADCIVTGFRVGPDGSVRLIGEFEAASK